jgi:hypothetical protein
MTYVGFEPIILASERAKTVHTLDRSATVTGDFIYTDKIIHEFLTYPTLQCLHISFPPEKYLMSITNYGAPKEETPSYININFDPSIAIII